MLFEIHRITNDFRDLKGLDVTPGILLVTEDNWSCWISFSIIWNLDFPIECIWIIGILRNYIGFCWIVGGLPLRFFWDCSRIIWTYSFFLGCFVTATFYCNNCGRFSWDSLQDSFENSPQLPHSEASSSGFWLAEFLCRKGSLWSLFRDSFQSLFQTLRWICFEPSSWRFLSLLLPIYAFFFGWRMNSSQDSLKVHNEIFKQSFFSTILSGFFSRLLVKETRSYPSCFKNSSRDVRHGFSSVRVLPNILLQYVAGKEV